MKYKLLGKTGIRVSELCLGAMTFGPEWGDLGSPRDEAAAVYRTYREAGGNFVDTANKYTQGTSEVLLGDFAREEREEVVIATKFTGAMREDDPNSGGNARKCMVQSVEASLRRLQTDFIDLLWVHAWDFSVFPEELMRALDDVVRAGKALSIGISNAPAWVVARCNTIAELRGWSAFAGLQLEYSLLERTPERELLPMAEALDIAVTPWSPLAGGRLTGKYRRHQRPSDGRQVALSEHELDVAETLVEIASGLGSTPARVALNWLRTRPCRVPVIPIVGARKPEQLEDSLACLSETLPDDARRRLDDATAIEAGYPHDFLNRSVAQGFIYGNTLTRIDDHHRRLPRPEQP